MFSKVLVPVDGSENSLRALDHAIYLAKKAGANITAMNVIENPPTVYVESQKLLNDLLANFRAESARILDKCKQIAEKNDVKIETIIGEGDAGSSIVGYAEKGGFDTIIIGRRGLGRFKEMVLGSISNKVLHHAKCSVMIVK
ncbi:MAG TPA: universal stress protein [Nitrososphaera sp.]|jgi:nucleotide-binding universal stress UspA family protein|nr:universal stress protein [Nitrososphaera sp.]